MPLVTRPDGARPVADLSTSRRMMAIMQPQRSQSVVFFGATLPAGRALAVLERVNRGRAEPVTFYELVLCAIARTLHERPHANRFVKGRRIWQREQVSLSFSVKKGMTDQARLTTVKVVFGPEDTLTDVADKVSAAIAEGRSDTETRAEKTSGGLLKRLPIPAVVALLGLSERLERWGLLPASMLESDPLQTSANVANLGSIGIDGCYHHLWDHGASSMMISLGRVTDRPVVLDDGTVGVGKAVDIKFAIDERICDGFYLARTLDALMERMKHPEALAGERGEGAGEALEDEEALSRVG